MKKLILSAALWLGAVAAAIAQQTGVPYFPQVLPAGTVIGRSTSGAGPAEAIPFARLLPFITAGSATFTGNITGGNVTANTNLSVTGTSTLTGAVTTGADITAGGSVTANTNLSVTGTSTLTGAVTTGAGITAGGSVSVGSTLFWPSKTRVFVFADGQFMLTNAAATGFSGLYLGPGNASYPSLVPTGSGGTLQVRLNDNSAFSPFEAASITSKTAAGVVAHQFDVNGKQRVGANTAPALTSCGTSPTITGNDHGGTVTMGTTATGCVITFNAAYASTPICVGSWPAQALASQSYVVSTTAITLTQTSTSNNIFRYICLAQSGG